MNATSSSKVDVGDVSVSEGSSTAAEQLKTKEKQLIEDVTGKFTGAPNDNFRKNICSEDDLRSRIFETFVVKFLACPSLLGFSNI